MATLIVCACELTLEQQPPNIRATVETSANIVTASNPQTINRSARLFMHRRLKEDPEIRYCLDSNDEFGQPWTVAFFGAF